MVSQDTFGSQQELQFPFPSFVTEDAQQAEQFMEQPPIDPIKIITLIQKNRHVKLAGQDKLRITASMPDLAARVTQVKQTIKQLLA